MSVNLSDPEVESSTARFYAKELNWVILSYPPQRDKLFLYGSGSGGVAECEGKLGEVGEEVAYVLVRAGEGGGEAFVTYVGEGVGGVKRARATVHGRLVGSKLFNPVSASFTINDASELPIFLQQELPSSSSTQSHPNGDQAPRPQLSPQPPNGIRNGRAEERGGSSSYLPPPPAATSPSPRPDLPHLHTLGPVQDKELRSREPSQERDRPLPTPVKNLPTPLSSSPDYLPPPDKEDRNGTLPLSPTPHTDTSSPPHRSRSRSPALSPVEPDSSRSTSNPISRLSSLKASSPTDSSFSGKSSSLSMGRPSIPLFSSLSILGRKGKSRSVSTPNGPPPVPPKDEPKTPTSASSFLSRFPIGNTSKPVVEEAPPSNVRGLDYSFKREERSRDASSVSSPVSSPRVPQQPTPSSPSTSSSFSPEDAYDAYDAGSPPRSRPSTLLPRTLPSPPQFPSILTTSPSASFSLRSGSVSNINPTTPLDLTKPRFPTIIARDQLQNPNHPSFHSFPSPSQPPPEPTFPEVTPPQSSLSHFRRISATDGAATGGWLQQEQDRRLEEDRRAMADRGAVREREEKEALERRKVREEERVRDDLRREEEKATRLRVARERTATLEAKETERREEEERKRVEGEMERREKEEMEMARVRVELGRAREEGGRLADGWLTVQAPNSVLFRRRYFYILPSRLQLFKSPEEISTPVTTIALPSNIEITDAYEEIQVLHSFRVESADGKTYLFYCDSEADKEVVVEAFKVAAKA